MCADLKVICILLSYSVRVQIAKCFTKSEKWLWLENVYASFSWIHNARTCTGTGVGSSLTSSVTRTGMPNRILGESITRWRREASDFINASSVTVVWNALIFISGEVLLESPWVFQPAKKLPLLFAVPYFITTFIRAYHTTFIVPVKSRIHIGTLSFKNPFDM